MKELYELIASVYDNNKLAVLDLHFDEDDYGGRIKFMAENWGEVDKSYPYCIRGKVTVDSFFCLFKLIKILTEYNLIMRERMFSTNRKIDDLLYIISINRADGRKIHVFCDTENDKSEIVGQLDNFRLKLKREGIEEC